MSIEQTYKKLPLYFSEEEKEFRFIGRDDDEVVIYANSGASILFNALKRMFYYAKLGDLGNIEQQIPEIQENCVHFKNTKLWNILNKIKDSNSNTALDYLRLYNHHALKLLYEKMKLDRDADPMHLAMACHQNDEVKSFLINNKNNPSVFDDIVIPSIIYNNYEIVEFSLKSIKIQMDFKVLFHYAHCFKRLEILELLKNEANINPDSGSEFVDSLDHGTVTENNLEEVSNSNVVDLTNQEDSVPTASSQESQNAPQL